MCVCCRCICVHVIMKCLVHWPWYEPATSAEVRQKTHSDRFLSSVPTALNYYSPFPRFLPPSPPSLIPLSTRPSLLIPHQSSLLPSLLRLMLSLLYFSGVLLWSTWTAGEPLTAEWVCVGGLMRWSVLSPPSFPHSLWPSLSSSTSSLLSKHPSSPPRPALPSSSSSSSFHFTSAGIFTPYHFLLNTSCGLWLS